jgi:hypothetical protein
MGRLGKVFEGAHSRFDFDETLVTVSESGVSLSDGRQQVRANELQDCAGASKKPSCFGKRLGKRRTERGRSRIQQGFQIVESLFVDQLIDVPKTSSFGATEQDAQ